MKITKIRQVTVVKSAEGNPRNDTASVVRLKNGRLMIVWHKYHESPEGGSDFGDCSVYSKTSGDEGLTWENERQLVPVNPGDLNVQAPALCRLPDNELLLICMRAHARNSSSMELFRSQDDGETFTHGAFVWERNSGQWLQGGASCLLRLKSGRLLIPFHGGTGDQASQHNIEKCFISDDSGKTWRLSAGSIDLPMRGAMEPFVAELKDGRLIMVMRNQLGSLFKSYSTDQGKSWNHPQTTGLSIPESCPYVTNIPGSDKIMVIWNNAEYNMHWRSHYGKRSPLTAAISADGGVTFTDFWDIETDPNIAFSNPGITWTRDGVCLLTYWVCPYSNDWIMNGFIDLRLARFRVKT